MRNSVYIHFNIYIYQSMSSDAHYPIMFGEHKLYGDHILYYTYIYIYTHIILYLWLCYMSSICIYMQNMRVVCHQYVYIYIYIYIYIQNMHISHSIHHRHGPIPSRWEPWPMANHSHSQITLWWSNVEMGHPSFIDISRLSFQQTTLPFTLWLWLT